MYKHILVPLDGSRMAESALSAAAYLAEKLAARVTLFHVVEKNAPAEVHGQTHLKNAAEAAAYLDGVVHRFFPEGIPVDCHVHGAEAESVARSIVEHAEELAHDLVVMCSHGRGRALHLFMGSIAQKVVAMDSRPVLITHPDEHGEPQPFRCRSILVPLDGEPDHAQALPVVKELAKACGSTLHLVQVIPLLGTLPGKMIFAGRMLPGTVSRMLELALQDAEDSFKTVIAALKDQGITASAHLFRGDPAAMIVEAADSSGVDLIVLATHGKAGMTAFWAGSVAHNVCSRCKAPLLLIPIAKAEP